MRRRLLIQRLLVIALAAIAIVTAAAVAVRELSPEIRAIRRLGSAPEVIEAPYFFEGGSIGLTLRARDGYELKCGVNLMMVIVEVAPGEHISGNPRSGGLCIWEHHERMDGAVPLNLTPH